MKNCLIRRDEFCHDVGKRYAGSKRDVVFEDGSLTIFFCNDQVARVHHAWSCAARVEIQEIDWLLQREAAWDGDERSIFKERGVQGSEGFFVGVGVARQMRLYLFAAVYDHAREAGDMQAIAGCWKTREARCVVPVHEDELGGETFEPVGGNVL